MKAKMSRALWEWFSKNGRHDLPWRHTRDPYKILVSEMMLQQTQVSRALLKYGEFLKQFPKVATLAQAPLGDVLRTWSGLGYNRRAKYLWECARIVEEKYRGKFPKNFHTLQKLPGIGRSTAAALMSFAFDADEPMIDTNIRRVLARIFVISSRNKKIHHIQRSYDIIYSDKALYERAKQLIPRGRGREWNWAMMDVGALVCKAKHHDDANCPFQKLHGRVGDFQYKKPAKKFQNSDRYYRGRMIATLACAPYGVARNVLCDRVKVSKPKRDIIIERLLREGLVVEHRGKITLPS